MRGDPDTIALKALEKGRARRYASAAELGADIGHYLRHEPVTAHPPGTAYRTRKYVRRHRMGLAVSAISLLAIALLLTWWRIPPAVPVVESVVPLTDDGLPKYGLVADRSQIYFEEGYYPNERIARVPITGGPVTPVETGIPAAVVVDAARDGSGLLVWVPRRFGIQQGPLWWVPLPGGEPHRLVSLDTLGADLLPDRRIVFGKILDPTNGTDGRNQIFIADKDGSNPRELVSLPNIWETWVSPDGRRVFFSRQLNGDWRIYSIRVDGRGLREIRKINDGESNFQWTLDEKYLVYQAQNPQQTDKQSDIWLLPIQAELFRRPGKPIRLTNGPIPYSSPLPSLDGKQIFVLGTELRGELVRYDMQSHGFTLFLSGISAMAPTFSRDGTWLAYVSYPDGTLWRSRSDATERKQLTYPPTCPNCASISPDGTKVAFLTDEFELFVTNMKGGQPQKIGLASSCGAWSPDGNNLYLMSTPFGAGGVIVEVRTRKKSAVPSAENMVGSWLTQDTLLCYDFVRRDKFQTFDLKTQKWTDFASGIVRDPIEWARLSADKKYLYFATEGENPKALRMRLSDQRVEIIIGLEDLHSVGYVTVAPDGSLIFTRDTGYQEIYALNIRWP